MEHELDLILTLTGALIAALVFGLFARRIGLSPIVGYLIAGVVVGPFTPGFVAHGAIASQFAELGVILLMFGVGLNLHVRELLAVRRVALPGAIAAIAAATAGGLVATTTLGWSVTSGAVYGLALAIASTVVLLRVFADKNLLQTQAGHVAVGWLLVEDLFVVFVIVLLPAVTGGHAKGGDSRQLVGTVALAIAKIAGLVVFTLLVGRRTIPLVLGFIARTRSRELFTLAVLVIALGVAVGSAKLFGASMALGALLAGLVVGQSDFGSRAASEALPMRDAFAVLFFVATGMLLDPSQVLPNVRLTVVTLAVVWIAKPLVALIVVLLLRYPAKTALGLAFGLAQIGEFSFMIAGLGRDLGVLPKEAMQSLVAVSIISIALNPFLLRLVEPASRRLARWAATQTPAGVEGPAPVEPAYRAVVVGYGPIGRTLSRLLTENGLEPTIIELNHETVASLRGRGIRTVYGDASQREILERAGVPTAGSLIFTSSSPPDAVIKMAKDLNPKLLVLARATYLRDVVGLQKAGANEVVSSEGEVALAMVERLLQQLGATGEQLDRARDRVRHEMLAMSGGGILSKDD
jgi:CPA2 family monovalent cation:H+ antiporter-2